MYPKKVKSKGNTIILTKKKQQNILEKLKSAFECLTEKLKPRQELWGQVTSRKPATLCRPVASKSPQIAKD